MHRRKKIAFNNILKQTLNQTANANIGP